MQIPSNPDEIFVQSVHNRLDRCAGIVVSYQNNHFDLSVPEARERALAIFTAAAIAESENAVINALAPAEKGFMPSPYSKEAKIKGALLHMIRENRPALPPGVSAIVGARTRQAIVQLEWYGKLQVSPDVARDHALNLLAAAESAQSDAFWYAKFKQLGWEQAQIEALMREFVDFRNQQQGDPEET